ncbi:hypothetical protein BBO99_00004324 [Phytophthora kernoviae]|uniref:SCP domain-containing protein n=1 Tax=Phytophthora kernoviae TaxID=325452 RepID=A0A3R7HXM0_9STRA|nr:hypothetical protein JM16_002507 [Phytophthora kernoviae]RLN10949.1 hypothetical protein BBI17_000754 [Phytophthora kernoviae]RLN80656.1 hypothetical protein BBO99_00004324 [Phytophthora kernoviae]
MPTFSQRHQHPRTTVLLVGLIVALVSNAAVASTTTTAAIGEAIAEETNATLVPPTRFLQTYKGSEFQSLLLAAVNKERAAVGVASLCMSNKLHSSAQGHSNDMATNNFMSHTGSNGSTMSQRITATGFKWTAVAENVAAGQKDVTAVMKSWMNSSGHKKNILSPTYKMFGCGYAYNSRSTYKHYWTQDFGTSSSSSESCSSSSTTGTTTKAPAVTTSTPVATTKAPAVTTPAATTKTLSTSTMQTQMLAAVNKQRAAAGLSALCMNNKLHSSAQGHSNDMAINNFMGHTGSNGSTMSQRITATGFKWTAIAENVAAGQTTVDSVMTAWMNSSGHKANILSSKTTMFGCAYAYNAGIGLLSDVVAQSGIEDGNQITQIGLETVNNAQVTSNLATSVQQVLSQYDTGIANNVLQQVKDAAGANNRLNTILQGFLQSLTDTGSNVSIFSGIRNLRTEPE